MRIIDKNRDFYDYLQSPCDNRIVFDRRGSFPLTKQSICHAFDWEKSPHRFLLLQCGGSFWLFYAEITERDSFGIPKDYDLELLSSWKDYRKENRLLDINVVSPKVPFVMPWKTPTKEEIFKYKDALQNEITHGGYSYKNSLSRDIKYTDYKGSWKKEELKYPLLKESGIAGLVDVRELFCAIEEYFSIEKSKSERTEPLGATNNDKIEAHGFDVRTSFRGKR